MFWGKLQFLQSVMKTTKSRDTLSIGNDSFQINASFLSDEESNDIDKKPTLEAKWGNSSSMLKEEVPTTITTLMFQEILGSSFQGPFMSALTNNNVNLL